MPPRILFEKLMEVAPEVLLVETRKFGDLLWREDDRTLALEFSVRCELRTVCLADFCEEGTRYCAKLLGSDSSKVNYCLVSTTSFMVGGL